MVLSLNLKNTALVFLLNHSSFRDQKAGEEQGDWDEVPNKVEEQTDPSLAQSKYSHVPHNDVPVNRGPHIGPHIRL